MSVFDEIYFETHEETAKEEYMDFLVLNCLTEDELSFFDFLEIL